MRHGFQAQSPSPRQAWHILGNPELLKDPAVGAGIDCLKSACAEIGISLKASPRGKSGEGVIQLDLGEVEVPSDPDTFERELIADSSYEIISTPGSPHTLHIRSRSPLGSAYALFHVADRIRVEGRMPRKNERVIPALPYRILASSSPCANTIEGPDTSPASLQKTKSKFEEQVKKVIEHGYNFVMLHNSQNHIPYVEEAYALRSDRYMQHLSVVVNVAHAYHLKILLIGDEFTYLPELLERFKAEPSVKNENLWMALKSKYRELLKACPELDGIGTRIGEHIPYFDFQTLDLIHSDESEPDPRIEERYRKFIKTMHDVVVGEFGKIYLHRTWTVNVHEQHSVPQIYARTFTPDVPTKNLLLAIKLTSGDQWYHCEPFNTTFGVTAHTTIAQGELYSGYQGGGTYIDYPARYFQAALEWAVDRGTRGIINGYTSDSLPADAILYVFSQLGWKPRTSVESLTEDWASKTFGRKVRKEVAQIFLLGAIAVRDGLYLRQPGLHNWDPIRHLRTDTFVMKGYPEWDNGKAHDQFLKGIYLECKPWLKQTSSELERGVATCERMLEIYYGCKEQILNPEKAEELEKLLFHGLATIRMNAYYVKGFLSYFKYREEPTGANRKKLSKNLMKLDEALRHYQKNFVHYKLQAIFAFMDLARRALEDLKKAERVLRESPSLDDLQEMFDKARRDYEKRLDDRSDAILIAWWKGTVDGRDLLRIKGESFTIEHISDDHIISPQMKLYTPIPTDRPCEIVIRPIDVRGAVFVKEQPTKENDHTLTLYLEDRTPGKSVFQFEVYAICD